MFVLSGTVDSLHLGDLLEWLHLTRATGRLLLAGESSTRAFDVVKGKVAFASSSRAAERLASWLLRKSLADRRLLLRALAVAQTGGETFTQVAEREGIAHDTLVEAGRSLANALASRTLRESRIAFTFDPSWPVTQHLHVDLQLECSKLIMQAAYTVDTRPPSESVVEAPPTTLDPEAVESLFWRICSETEGTAIEPPDLAEAHTTLKKVGELLNRWVTSGPPLLPVVGDDATRVTTRLEAGEPLRLDDSPTLGWDLLSLVNSLDAPGFSRATSVAEAWTLAGADAPMLVRLLIENSRWRRDSRAGADGALRRAALARAAAGRRLAEVVKLGVETAATAAALPIVTLELVVTALASAPLATSAMQRAALRHLLPLVGHAAGTAAGHPDVLLSAIVGRPPEHPGARVAALAAGAARELGGDVYPGVTLDPVDEPDLVAAFGEARAAAHKAVEGIE